MYVMLLAFWGLATAVVAQGVEWKPTSTAGVRPDRPAGLLGFRPEQAPSEKTATGPARLRWLSPATHGRTSKNSPLPTEDGGREGNAAAVAAPAPLAEVVSVVLEAPALGETDDVLADPFGDRSSESGQSRTTPRNHAAPTLAAARPPQALQPPEVLPPPAPIIPPPQGETKSGPKTSPMVANAQPPSPSEPLPRGKPPEQLLEAIPQGPTDERPMEQQLTQVPGVGKDECPPFERMRKITEITDNIAPKPGKFPVECPLGGGVFTERRWAPTTFTWTASALCHKPLYFEQVGVERYGHNLGPILQPFASGAHFFLTIPILPYKMGLTPPNECIYTLGYYRPGSCAPRILDPFPLSVRAALAEGGAWTGLAFLVP